MATVTRSQIRVFHPNPTGKSPSSTVISLSPSEHGVGARVTYSVRRKQLINSQPEHATDTNEIIVDVYKGDRVNETLELVNPPLAFIHIEPTGSTFLEALPASKEITLCRVGTRNPHPSRISSVIPTSKDGATERVFVLLDSDALIVIDGMLKLMYETIEASIAVPSTDMAMEFEITATGNGAVGEDSVVRRTPSDGKGGDNKTTSPIPDIVPEGVNRVLDTPHNRNRFTDIKLASSASGISRVFGKEEEGQSPSPSFMASMSTSGLLYGEHVAGIQDSNAIAYEDGPSTGDDNVIAYRISEPISSTPSPSMKLPDLSVPSADPRTSEGKSNSTTSVGLPPVAQAHCSPSAHSRTPSVSVESAGAVEEDEKQFPDSLPPTFTIERRGKLFSPPAQRTYSKINARKAREKLSEETEESDIWDPPEETQPTFQRLKGLEKTMVKDPSQPYKEKDQDAGIAGVDAIRQQETSIEVELSCFTVKTPSKGGKKKRVPVLAENADTNTLIKAVPHRKSMLKKGKKEKEAAKEIASTTKTSAKETPTRSKRRRTSQEAQEEEAVWVSPPLVPSMESTVQVAIPRKQQVESDSQPNKKARILDITVESVDTFLSFAAKTPKSTTARNKRKPRASIGSPAKNTPTQSPPKSPNVRTQDRYKGPQPHIVLSNTPLMTQKSLLSTLRSLLMKKSEKVTDKGVNYLVIGAGGGLVRSSKLALSIALGIQIVEDSWIHESTQVGYILDPEKYFVKSEQKEKEWGFVLEDAIERGRSGVIKRMLEGYTVYITPTLLAQLKNSNQEVGLTDVLRCTGVVQIIKKSPRGPPLLKLHEEGKQKEKVRQDEDDINCNSNSEDDPAKRDSLKVLVFGSEKGDKDVPGLNDLGHTVWKTEMLTMSILRGELLTQQDDFKVMVSPPPLAPPSSSFNHAPVGKPERSSNATEQREGRQMKRSQK